MIMNMKKTMIHHLQDGLRHDQAAQDQAVLQFKPTLRQDRSGRWSTELIMKMGPLGQSLMMEHGITGTMTDLNGSLGND